MKLVQIPYFECDKCGKQLRLKINMIKHESTCIIRINKNQMEIFEEDYFLGKEVM